MKNHIWHIVATLIVGVWGLTFISTKVLIESGMSPQEIFFARFLIAYVGIWFISPRILFAYNWKDELLLLAKIVVSNGAVQTMNDTLLTKVIFIAMFCARKKNEPPVIPLASNKSSSFQL